MKEVSDKFYYIHIDSQKPTIIVRLNLAQFQQLQRIGCPDVHITGLDHKTTKCTKALNYTE